MDLKYKHLLKQLLTLGDITLVKRSAKGIAAAIAAKDVEALAVLLEDTKSYQETSKSNFIDKIRVLFDEMGPIDIPLAQYPGQCNSDVCSNKGKCGILFYSNSSQNYFNLIFEQDEQGQVTDLYTCNDFHCEESVLTKKVSRELNIKVFDDEEVSFEPNEYYHSINNNALKALNEWYSYQNQSIEINTLANWLDKHAGFFKTLFIYTIRYKNEDAFYTTYLKLRQLHSFFMLQPICLEAVETWNSMDAQNEKNQLKWLVQYEYLKPDMVDFEAVIINQLDTNSEYVFCDKPQNIVLSAAPLEAVLQFHSLYTSHYPDVYSRYQKWVSNSYSKKKPTLHFTLKELAQKLGIDSEKYAFLKQIGKNSFLYSEYQSFSPMQEGVAFDNDNFPRPENKKEGENWFEILE
jgi:hypothetical protein